jgi:6-pyruvoyltetrahydropterin/6-carboxytetrahydropterin synthase
MVFDFGEIKRRLSAWIDDALDHRMILNREDPAVPLMEQLGEPVYLMDTNPTAENIARLIFERAAEQGLPVVEVRLWETPHCSAAYCPEAGSAHSIPSGVTASTSQDRRASQ